MKRALVISACAIIGLGLSACETTTQTTESSNSDVASTEKKGHSKRERRSSGAHSKGAFLESYDLDGDGRVTEAEFYEARDQGYEARDADGNGRVVPDEYVAEYEERLNRQLTEQRDRQLKQAYVRFDVLDGDKDGVMTREEFRNSGKRMFDRLDTNKDGVVDENDTAKRY